MNTQNQESISTDVSFADLSAGFSFSVPQEEGEEVKEKSESKINSFEPPTDVPEETEKEVVAEEKVIETKSENSFYTDLIKKKISKGLWEDALVKDGDKEIKISDFENATEEDYLQFEEDQKALKDEDLKDKYLDIQKVTPENKLILEIIKNGGNLREIFQNEEALKKPFDEADGWDLTNEKHQESAVYQHYLSLGNTPSKSAALVKIDKEDQTLDLIAKEIVEFHQKDFSDKLQKVNTQLIQDNKDEADNIKKHYQDLIKTYKELGVPDADAKKYATSSIKEVEGQYEVDARYEEIMKDPAQASELIFFILDREKYKKAQGISTKIETQGNVLRLINRIPKGSTEAVKEEQKEKGFSFQLK